MVHMLISLTEYAISHNKNPANARQLALRGSFSTAIKIGRNWAIESTEPWPDRRVKSGCYIGKRKKVKNDKQRENDRTKDN